MWKSRGRGLGTVHYAIFAFNGIIDMTTHTHTLARTDSNKHTTAEKRNALPRTRTHTILAGWLSGCLECVCARVFEPNVLFS